MAMSRYLSYYLVRSAARELDREGRRPDAVLRVIVGVASAAALGLLAIGAFAVVWTGLAMARIVT
jgi:hypothetical protein